MSDVTSFPALFTFDVTVTDMTSVPDMTRYRTEDEMPPPPPPMPPPPQPPAPVLPPREHRDPMHQLLKIRQAAINQEMEAAYFTHMAKICEAEATKYRIQERQISMTITPASSKPSVKRAHPEATAEESDSGTADHPQTKKPREEHPVDKLVSYFGQPTVKYAEETVCGETMTIKVAKIPLTSEPLLCLSDIAQFVSIKRNSWNVAKRILTQMLNTSGEKALWCVYKLPALNDAGRKIGGTGTFYADVGTAARVFRKAMDYQCKPEVWELVKTEDGPGKLLRDLVKKAYP